MMGRQRDVPPYLCVPIALNSGHAEWLCAVVNRRCVSDNACSLGSHQWLMRGSACHMVGRVM